MQYFVELVKSRKTKYEYTEYVNSYSEWRDCFIESYYKGMQGQLLWKMTAQDAYYISKEYFLLPEQVSVAFQNLIQFLTMIDFNNKNITVENKIYMHTIESFFIRSFNMDVNLCFWNMSGINLSCANFSYANFFNADLSGADLSGADLSGAIITGTDLSGANLSGANLSDAELFGADLSGADLNGADLNGANLSVADLSDANLFGADLSDADLLGTNLSGADLSDADLLGTNLSGADLSDADLLGTNLSGANLNDADLNNVHLFESDLPKFDDLIKKYGVKLINPIIDDVDMTKYFYDSETNRIRPK